MLSLPGGGTGPYIATGQMPYGLSTAHDTSYPDYNSIIERLMAPIRAQIDARLKALQAQTTFGQTLGQDNSRLTMEALAQAHAAAQKNIVDVNTAHGLINSGDTHYRMNQEQRQYARAQAGEQNQLLAYLTNLANQLTQAKLQAQAELEQALQAASQNASTNYTPTVGGHPWTSIVTGAGIPQGPAINPGLLSQAGY